MAAITGKDGYVTKQVSGVDTLIVGIREWQIDYTSDLVDVTAFAVAGVTHKSKMAALNASTGSFVGTIQSTDVDVDGGTAYNIMLNADTNRAYYGTAYIQSVGTSIIVDGEARATYTFEFTGKVYVLGANLVVNGTFTTDVSWDKGTDWTIDGTADVDGQGAAGDLEASIDPLSATTEYWTQYTISALTDGTIIIDVGTTDGTSRSATGTYTEIITSVGDGTLLFTPSVSATLSIDNVIVREVLN